MQKTNLFLFAIFTISYQYTPPEHYQHGPIHRYAETVFEWNYLNFTLTSLPDRYRSYIKTLPYIPTNIVMTSMRHYKNKVCLALPRFQEGVPTTMATIPAKPADGNLSPLLTPFPDQIENMFDEDCNTHLISVHSFEINIDGMMWVIDIGRREILTKTDNDIKTCAPSLVFFDLNEEVVKIKSRIFMPESVADSYSYLNDIVIDKYDGGYAYITDDSDDPGIIVYSKRKNAFWKFRHRKSMLSDPTATIFRMDDQHFEAQHGIAGIALGQQYFTEFSGLIKNVYYAPISSRTIYVVSTAVLRNESLCNTQTRLKYDEDFNDKYVGRIGTKTFQTASMIADENGLLYYGLIGQPKVKRWKENTKDWPFVYHNSTWTTTIRPIQHHKYLKNRKLTWIDRFDIDDKGNLYMLNNYFHKKGIAHSIDKDVINFRIMKTHIATKSYLHSRSFTAVKKPF